jgi:hypothetical protein
MDTVEELQQLIGRLALERQSLREAGAERAQLEQNRIELAQAQLALAHALIDRHHPAAA